MDLKEKIKNLPLSPGVYLMKDASARVIYIGKAVSLKKRVSSYFDKKAGSYKNDLLVSNIRDVDYIPTSSEEEALLLEAALVREKQPKYNILLKDDKRYPLLKLTLNEEFPRLITARRKLDDNAMYFGPYTNAKLLRNALAICRRIFPLRICKSVHESACLNYHIGKCFAPCIKKTDKQGYRQVVEDVVTFLKGKKRELIKSLTVRMNKASADKDFEKAARLRDQIQALAMITAVRPSIKTTEISVLELQGLLGMKKPPMRIEAFDISNLSGREAVGSMVSFFNARPDKSNYRKFKIKYVFDVDDYKMIEEVVTRRYKRILNDNEPMPDLIIIDGGRGHVSAAKNVLSVLNLDSVPLVGIAKKEERVFSSEREIRFDKDSKALQLIMRVRDEAHRFAQAYHHILRRKKIIGR
jgi:excinuclease ABC subunit C